ncbi:hypothetical protein EBT31_08925, partial [bacterium]|nr:hypothetical protein [bacterium]
LAGLRRWTLERDDTGPHRVYRDQRGNIYTSVTHILKETSDTTGLVRWEQRLGAVEANVQRNVAATRGNMAHNQAEYLLKTSQQLARSTANKRNSIRWDEQGLARIPPAITQWALKRVRPNVPNVGFSAKGYARGLSDWITENVTEIFASEFSIHHPAGFAGTADALLTIKGHSGLIVTDWKTSVNRKNLDSSHSYVHQCGAYSLGLKHLTGLQASGAMIVLARRCGAPQTHSLDADDLRKAETAYLDRVEQYFDALHKAIQENQASA